MTGAAGTFEFDAAISFLSRDLAIATQLKDLLVPAVNTFVYSRNQEAVAATDGLESFRSVFRDRSRLSIVLHRQGWGSTPWTGVEEIAIRDRCLTTKYRSLVIASIDGAPLPDWVPDTYIHFNLGLYSLAELAGIVKARLQELGGQIKVVSTLDLARQKGADEEFRVESERYFNTPDGIAEADASAREAMRTFCESALELRNVTAGWIPQSGCDDYMAVARMGHASVQILWRRQFINSLKGSVLRIRCFEGGLAIPGRQEVNYIELNERGGEAFEPVRTRGLELRWKPAGGAGSPLSSEELGHRATLKLAECAEAYGPRLL